MKNFIFYKYIKETMGNLCIKQKVQKFTRSLDITKKIIVNFPDNINYVCENNDNFSFIINIVLMGTQNTGKTKIYNILSGKKIINHQYEESNEINLINQYNKFDNQIIKYIINDLPGNMILRPNIFPFLQKADIVFLFYEENKINILVKYFNSFYYRNNNKIYVLLCDKINSPLISLPIDENFLNERKDSTENYKVYLNQFNIDIFYNFMFDFNKIEIFYYILKLLYNDMHIYG